MMRAPTGKRAWSDFNTWPITDTERTGLPTGMAGEYDQMLGSRMRPRCDGSKAAYRFLVVTPPVGGAASRSNSLDSTARSWPGTGQPWGTALYMKALLATMLTKKKKGYGQQKSGRYSY